MTVVNLPGGPEANADPSKAGEWGAATVKALQDWQFPVSWSRFACCDPADTTDRRRLRVQVEGGRVQGEHRVDRMHQINY